MSGNTRPTQATIKRLFAVSGNQCAFPNCKVPVVDALSGKVTGRICHIKAQSPGGKRHDISQTDAERHAFENLILMCPIHHDVIDADEQSYTVERLYEIKATHESTVQDIDEPEADVVEQFMQSVSNSVISDGSAIFSQGQMGGQIAHNITNVGSQPRQITVASANQLIAELRRLPPENVKVVGLMGDPESISLAHILLGILSHAGWHTETGIDQAVFGSPVHGVILRLDRERPAAMALGNWLVQTFGKSHGELVPGQDYIEVVVGANL